MTNLTNNSDKIKILYLVLEMELGGLQRIVNLVIDRIDRNKFTPYLCCLDRGGMFYEQLKSDSVKTYILQRRPGPFDIRMAIRLYKILRENKIDVIHSQSGCMGYAAIAGRLARVKGIIHTDHGRFVPDKRSAILEERISSILINRVIGVSEELTDYLASEVKIKREKLIIIINGVDVHRFIPLKSEQCKELRNGIGVDEEDKILGTVCRLEPVKNLEFLIDCMPFICEVVPGCKLLIVGDGPIKEHLIKYSESLGIDSKINFMGEQSDIEDILPVFDIYVCTSLSEGTSMTILEAMACGLPIVASAVGGNCKLVDDSNGRLFPLNDVDAFKRNIIDILNNARLMNEMGQNSRKKAENNFNFDQFVRQHEELYSSVCHDR